MGLVRTNARQISTYRILDATVLSADLTEALIQYADVEISSVQLKNLYSSAHTIVAAKGANTIIEFISLQINYDYDIAAYGVGTSTNLIVKFDTSDLPVSSSRLTTGFIDQGDDQVSLLVPIGTTSLDVKSSIDKALKLTLAVGNPGNGSAAGVLHLKVAYRVHATGL